MYIYRFTYLISFIGADIWVDIYYTGINNTALGISWIGLCRNNVNVSVKGEMGYFWY